MYSYYIHMYACISVINNKEVDETRLVNVWVNNIVVRSIYTI